MTMNRESTFISKNVDLETETFSVDPRRFHEQFFEDYENVNEY
jgi:hypothetical protein